jgi:hypothetical protein
MRVLALMKYGARAASTRQRLLQYRPYLAEHGVEIEVSPLLDDDHIRGLSEGRKARPLSILAAYVRRIGVLLQAARYDVVWVHCEVFPYLPGFLEQSVGLAGRPVILDFDDAIFHGYDRHANPIIRRFLGRKLVGLMRDAFVCICGNAYLQAYASQHTKNAIVVPTVVDTSVYVPAEDDASPERRVVGWIGSPSTWAGHLKPLLPTLLPMLRENGAVLKVVGAGPDAQGIEGIESVDWSEAAEVAAIQGMDVGIMPLPDDDWARGKCGYKLIQYMACGLPVIASPVGVNSQIVEHGISGFLAEGQSEWAAALARLLADPSLRHSMGRAGRDRVVAQYSLASQKAVILDQLRAAAGQGRRARATAPG